MTNSTRGSWGAGITTACLMACAATQASANPMGTVTVYNYAGLNGGPTSIEGALGTVTCNGTGVVTCIGFNPIASNSSQTDTITSNVSSSMRYGIVIPQIKYQDNGDIESPASFTPTCALDVSISSNGSYPPVWTGGVTGIIVNGDASKSYTPVCTYSNFLINSSSGNWSVTFTWHN